MKEQKCDFSIVVEKSGGRATCPDRFFRTYKSNNNCSNCPKALSAKRERVVPLSEGELAAIDLIREIKLSALEAKGK